MRQFKFSFLIKPISCFLVVLSLAFVSCKEEEDILVDYFMAWSLDDMQVPTNGGFQSATFEIDSENEVSYSFVCANTYFSKVKIKECEIDGVPMSLSDDDNYNPLMFNGGWFTINLDGMDMTVSFLPNETGKERSLYFYTTSGDGYVTWGFWFTFIQPAQAEPEPEE